MRRLVGIAIATAALVVPAGAASAKTWTLGEHQLGRTFVNSQPGDRIDVFMRPSERSAVKCASWGGDGVTSKRWRGATWHVCKGVDW